MSRKYIDCREFPSEMNCSVALSADSDAELLEAARRGERIINGGPAQAGFLQGEHGQ